MRIGRRLRYIYWLIAAFFRKNFQSIIISFIVGILAIIAFISFSPYILQAFTTETRKIGVSGVYTIDSLPDEIVSKFSNGLLYVNNDGELIPLLADSWEVLDEGQVYRFHLKEGLEWNDGTPFTAEQINYSFRDIEIKAENDKVATFYLPKPLEIFPLFLTKPIVRVPLKGVGGAYTVDNLKVKSGIVKQIRLTPNQPEEPILVYKMYDTDTKLIEAYKLGEVTEMIINQATLAQRFKNWNNTIVEETVDYTKVMTLFFNLNDPFLGSEKDIRQAVAQGVDKTQFEEFGEIATGPLPPTSWAYEPDVKLYLYDRDLAEGILDTYTDSEATASAGLTLSTYYDHLIIADNIKNYLNDIGLNVNVEIISANLPQDYQLFLANVSLSKDPDQYFFWHSTQTTGNITNYKNVKVDKLLEDGRSTINRQERRQLYSSFQKTIVDDLPAYFLYHPYVFTIRRK